MTSIRDRAPVLAAPARATSADTPTRRVLALAGVGALLLHAALVWLEAHRIRIPSAPPFGSIVGGHLSFLLILALSFRFGPRVALIAAVPYVLTALPWPLGVGFVLFAAASFGISRLRWPAALRVLLVLALAAWLPALRAGLAGEKVAGSLALAPLSGTVALWSMVLLRSILYQVEGPHLPRDQRGWLAYTGSLGLASFAGATSVVAVLYAQLFGRMSSRLARARLLSGLGLVALGATYLVAHWLLMRAGAVEVTPGVLARAARAGTLDAYLASVGRWRVMLDLAGSFPRAYLEIAGNLFVVIGNLRLLGFDLGSGFERPFASRTLMDFWRRWDFYFRDVAMRLFYGPAVDGLRHRGLPLGLVHTLGVTSAFAGLILLRCFVLPLGVQVDDSPAASARLWAGVTGTAIMGLLTAAGAAWAVRAGARRASHSRLAQLGGIVLTLCVVDVVWATCFALLGSVEPSDIARIAAFVAGLHSTG